MHARIVSISGVDSENRYQVMEAITERVLPMLHEQKGFSGYLALYDEKAERVKGIVLWETAEAAEAAEEIALPLRQQAAGEIGFTVESADLYQVPVVDLATARV